MSANQHNAAFGQRPVTTGPYCPSSASSSKTKRVLACAICQQRKVKCDRNFPCANCIRSGVQCVGPPLAPRQRKRRFPERHLLDRLRHYEELLRQNRIEFEPLHGEQKDNSARATSESTCVDGPERESATVPHNAGLQDIKGAGDKTDDHPMYVCYPMRVLRFHFLGILTLRRNFWQVLRRQGVSIKSLSSLLQIFRNDR